MTDAHAETETPICPGCMNEVAPDIDFCPHCRAPLDSTVAVDPIRRIRAIEYIYEKAVRGLHTPFQILALVVFLGPVVLFGLIMLLSSPFSMNAVPEFLTIIAFAIIYSLILYRATRNYIRYRNAQNEDDSPPE